MDIIVQKLVNAIENVFIKEIENAYDKSKKKLSEQDIVLYDSSVIKELLRELLGYHTWRLCQKTFVYEFHKYRKSLSLPVDPTSSKAFDLYVNLIDENLLKNWFLKYNCLQKMVTQSVKNTCVYVEEVCSNFSHDIILLCDHNMVDRGSKLNSISPLNSDPHNGSKVALCFKFEPTKKVIYKPRSLGLDNMVSSIFTDILKFNTLPSLSPVAPTLDKGKYGWQGFIQHFPIEKKEACEAYYNLGLCAAVFSSLGATDLHDENIIFNGIAPYFIDLETSLRPTFYQRCNSLYELMEDIIFRSVVSTSILPAKLPTMPHQILIGAINTPYPQETNEKMFNVKNPGTDAIDIAKEKIKIVRPTLPITLVGDQPLDPLPFQLYFLNGYTDGYKKIMCRRKEICSLLSDIQCSVRVIVRPTVQYALMLDASLFPENLIDNTTINKVLNYLKPSKLFKNTKVADCILREELRSIKNGDIPYFYTRANDTYMCTGNVTSDRVFDVSPVSNAINSLEKLSEERLILDKRLIAEGYSEIRLHEAKYAKVDNVGYLSPFFSQILRSVTKDNPYPLVDLIQSLAITNKNETGWLGGVYGECSMSYSSSSFISLHDTGGIIFLFEQLAEYKEVQNRDKYITLFKQAKRGLKSLCNELSSQINYETISIISGSSSFDYIFEHKERCLKRTEEIIEHLQLEKIPFGDVFMGPMGVGLLLATFPETSRNILEKINNMFQKDVTFEFSKNGIAHGELGALWTEFRLSYVLGNIERSKYIFRKTMKYYIELSGWCNGNAGLLMVLSEMASILNESPNLYEIANKATLLPETQPVDISICHGASGVLQSLLFTYATSGDLWYLSLANQYWENVLRLANKNGFYTGEKNRDYLLGYFLGWSGMAESALLLQIYNRGSSSWFPLNLSSNTYQKILFKGDNT